MMQDLEAAERAYQARPKPVPLTGIVPGDMVGGEFGAGGSAYLIENGWFGTVNVSRYSLAPCVLISRVAALSNTTP